MRESVVERGRKNSSETEKIKIILLSPIVVGPEAMFSLLTDTKTF
jgi:hypothetical protein